MRFKKIRHSPTSTNHSLNAHLLLETTSAVLHVHADRLDVATHAVAFSEKDHSCQRSLSLKIKCHSSV